MTLAAGQAYQAAFTPAEAFEDLEDMAAVTPDDPIRIAFYTRPSEPENRLKLKIFHAGNAVALPNGSRYSKISASMS